MATFDIQKLLDFEPPRYRCFNCLALWRNPPMPKYTGKWGAPMRCPNCRIEYVQSQYDSNIQLDDYLRVNRNSIEIQDVFKHARDLGEIARKLRRPPEPYSPTWEWNYPYLKGLLQALSTAKSFVHFTSFGISSFMIGVLKLAAQRIAINGVVSASSSNVIKVITSNTDYEDEARNLEVRVLASEGNSVDLPHQKLIIIDGLLAFKGSVNLHEAAWRKAEQDLEEVQVVTDVSAVVELNNRFFSSAWLRADKGDKLTIIEMTGEPPPWFRLDLELGPE